MNQNSTNQDQIKKEKRRLKRQRQRKSFAEKLNNIDEDEKQKIIQKYWDKKNPELKQQRQEKMQSNFDEGLKIFFDYKLSQYNSLKWQNSLFLQLEMCYQIALKSNNKYALYFQQIDKESQQQYLSKNNNKNHVIQMSDQDLKNLIDDQKKNQYIYLSPDAAKPLETIDTNKIYIIGCLIDSVIIPNVSLNRANELGIESRYLPLKEAGVDLGFVRKSLNINKVFQIIDSALETGSLISAIQKEFKLET